MKRIAVLGCGRIAARRAANSVAGPRAYIAAGRVVERNKVC